MSSSRMKIVQMNHRDCMGAYSMWISPLCLPGFKRFALSLAGIHGDKRLGIEQPEIAAERGH
jgi:hypothetical protein